MSAPRKNSTEWKRSFLLHTMMLGTNIYGFLWILLNFQLKGWGGISVYFTVWSHAIQIIYFILVVLFDIKRFLNFKTNTLLICSKAQSLAFTVSFVCSSITGFIFWSIYFYNRDLILPASIRPMYPMFINLIQHGATVFFIWFELLIQPHRNLPLKTEVKSICFVGVSYFIWNNLAAYYNTWPYPFQKNMNVKQFAFFYCVMILLVAGFLKIKRFLVGHLWGHNDYKIANPAKPTPAKRKASKH